MTKGIPTETSEQRDELLRLAERCEKATGPDRELDIRICTDALGKSRLDEGFQTAPRYTASLDAAMTLAEGYMLVALSDIAADGLTGCCLCSDTSANPPTEHWGIPSEHGPRQEVMARAVCAAALRACAAQIGDQQ